jgi:tripartite-type tricarboxylate transporter receptor subunit TctC
VVGHRMSRSLGKPFVIQNVPGAAGTVAGERVANATPDGYTIGLMTEAQMLVNPILYSTAYDTTRDFAAVSQLASAPYLLLLHGSIRAKTLRELVTVARAEPGALTFGSPGSGSTPHIAGELFRTIAAIDVRHVPYKGVGPAVPDLLSGRIDMMFTPAGTALPLLRDGTVRALGVSSQKRLSAAPDVPTIAESGYRDFDVTGWLALVAPAKTPPTIVRTLYLEASKAIGDEDARIKLTTLGLEPIASAPEAFAALIRPSAAHWAALVRRLGIRPE